MIDTFTELDDRYEKELEVNSESVVISIDKSDYSSSAEELIDYVTKNTGKVLLNAYEDFNDNKASYNIGYIDDLTDTQIILASDIYSIYWVSVKGEVNGESIIGVEYSWPEKIYNGLTIGD